MLAIRPVRSRADLTTFITLPRVLYRGMPGYVAPLDFERRQLLDPKKSPYFEHAEVQYFLAYRDAQPVGRISAQVDRLAIETWGAKVGCFGCLDAVDDPAVVRALCDAAADWLRERSMEAMRGPFSLSINNETGLQVSGQEQRAMILMPWHPAYLAPHVAAAGLDAAKDVLAFTVPIKTHQRPDHVLAMAEGRLPASVRIRKLDLAKFDREAQIICTVFNQAWQNNWSFVPFTKSEAAVFAKSFRHFLIPECGVIAELDGQPVAIAVVLPNIFDVVHDFGGRLLPFNWVKFLLRAFRISSYRSIRLPLFGVIPQLHRVGAPLALVMLDHLIQLRTLFDFEEMEAGWILEDNRALLTMMSAMGVSEPSKRYRIFEKRLTV